MSEVASIGKLYTLVKKAAFTQQQMDCVPIVARQISQEKQNLDVCVTSPDCKMLSIKFRKTISLNILKAKQNVTHLQGGPATQATRMWPLPYAHASPVPTGTFMGNYKNPIGILNQA